MIWKIATFVLLLIVIIAIFLFVLDFKMDESYVDGYDEGREEMENRVRTNISFNQQGFPFVFKSGEYPVSVKGVNETPLIVRISKNL